MLLMLLIPLFNVLLHVWFLIGVLYIAFFILLVALFLTGFVSTSVLVPAVLSITGDLEQLPVPFCDIVVAVAIFPFALLLLLL